ncbi:MAG: hypothetical protein QM640_07240 [Niabella sp.]
MMTKKTVHLLALGVLVNAAVYAQSVEDGVKAYYNGNYPAAVSILEKQADKPEGAYWLAESYFELAKDAKAQEVINKALTANAGNPLLLAAKGHSLLLQNKTAEATQSFDAAVAAAKKDDEKAQTLNAVGHAITRVYNNVDKVGDINYAVQKLKDAKAVETGIKEKNQNKTLLADINTNLADATLKAHPGEGSEAFTLYQDALTADPSFGKAEYRKAMIFRSQRNVDLYLSTLQKALTANPNYMPALSALYEYNAFTVKDMNAAKPYGDKIVSLLPPSPNNEYFKAVASYMNKQYPEAINIGKTIISQAGDQANPQVYKLVAYSLIENKDTAAAIPYVDDYFKNQTKEEILPKDYSLKATAYSTTPGKEDEVVKTYMDAAAADTTVAGKVEILETGAKMFASAGKNVLAGDLYGKILEVKPADKLTINDFFNAGYSGYYKAGQYDKAWKVFDAARTKFPKWNYGYQLAYASSSVFDSTNAQNIMVPDAEKYINFLKTDTASNAKSQIFSTAYNLANYYNDVAKDKTKAIEYLQIMSDNTDDPNTKQQIQQNIQTLSAQPKQSTNNTESKAKGGK